MSRKENNKNENLLFGQNNFSCTKRVADLFGKGMFEKAFNLLDQYIEKVSSTSTLNLLGDLTVLKVQFHSADKAMKLGIIQWDQYRLDKSKVVKYAIELAGDLCRLIHPSPLIDDHRWLQNYPDLMTGAPEYVQHELDLWEEEKFSIVRSVNKSFKKLIYEINALELKENLQNERLRIHVKL